MRHCKYFFLFVLLVMINNCTYVTVSNQHGLREALPYDKITNIDTVYNGYGGVVRNVEHKVRKRNLKK